MELKNDEQRGGEFEEHLLLLGSSLFFLPEWMAEEWTLFNALEPDRVH